MKFKTFVLIIIFLFPLVNLNYVLVFADSRGQAVSDSEAQISGSYEPSVTVNPLPSLVDLLIITSPEFRGYASLLAEHKNSIGISTVIQTTDIIYSLFSGIDNPEKIRNYIISVVEDLGITSVLIYGDDDQVPVRYVYIPDGEEDDSEEYDGVLVETDLYYADLQYTWDTNEDGLWGDLDNDQIDGIPDISIGRLPVSFDWSAQAVLDKIINYETYNGPNDPWFNSVLLLGTDLFEEPGAEGEILMDYIADEFVWDNFTVIKSYMSQDNLSTSTVQTEINEGVGFVNFAGHGSPNSWFLDPEYYSSWNAEELMNGLELPVIFAMACSTSRFADYDGIGEILMANPDGGAIAYFGSTRVSWLYVGEWATTGLAGEMVWRFNKAFFDGTRITGAVWKLAMTEYMQVHSIDTNYDGYYLDWKVVAGYGSPFMDPTLMIGGRVEAVEEETYSASVLGVVYPSEVYVGDSFTVDVAVSYDFTVPTRMFSGISDLDVGGWVAEEYETLVGTGTKTYTFDLTSPEEETTWGLNAAVWYVVDGVYVHDDTGYSVAFEVPVVSLVSDFSIDYVSQDVVEYGDTLTVRGSGVTAGTIVSIFWDYTSGPFAHILNTTEGNPDGTFELEIDVPSDVVGDHYLWARDTATGGTVSYGPLTLVSDIETHEIILYTGWNLIGLPTMPENPSIEVILSDIIDYVESVWTFEGDMKTWSVYSPGAPSDLTEMVDDKGYWIKMNADATLIIRARR